MPFTLRNSGAGSSGAVVAIKLARAVYFMLKNKTIFDADRWSPP